MGGEVPLKAPKTFNDRLSRAVHTASCTEVLFSPFSGPFFALNPNRESPWSRKHFRASRACWPPPPSCRWGELEAAEGVLPCQVQARHACHAGGRAVWAPPRLPG